MKWATLTAVAMLAVVGGCTGQPGTFDKNSDRESSDLPPILALIDTGVNPYHEAFQTGENLTDKLVRAGIPVSAVVLSRAGNYTERLQADTAIWNNLKPEVLYYFVGTRILAISFGADTRTPIIDEYNSRGHGTLVVGEAAKAAPDALIVMVQFHSAFCAFDGKSGCMIDPSLAHGMSWIANESWIDVASVSSSTLAGAPAAPGDADKVEFVQASRLAASRGMLLFGSAGNQPTPTYENYLAGPPWIVSVGGIEQKAGGESVVSGQGMDVAANFTETRLPSAHTISEYVSDKGTSFSAPLVAGVVTESLALETRQLGTRSVERQGILRDALNATAAVLGPSDWHAGTLIENLTDPRNAQPSIPLLFPGQIGWGIILSQDAQRVAAAAASRAQHVHDETAAAQGAYQASRTHFWS